MIYSWETKLTKPYFCTGNIPACSCNALWWSGTAAVFTCNAPLVLWLTAFNQAAFLSGKPSKYKQDSKSRFYFPLVSGYGNLRALRNTFSL